MLCLSFEFKRDMFSAIFMSVLDYDNALHTHGLYQQLQALNTVHHGALMH